MKDRGRNVTIVTYVYDEDYCRAEDCEITVLTYSLRGDT